jgi:tetratricopeptide (TPR) repeat protein
MSAKPMISSHSTIARVLGLAAVGITLLGVAGCNKLKARDLLNKGVAAFKNGQYDSSIEDFKQAKDLDPTLLNARLYLATAYATEYIPGAPSDENVRVGQQAVSEFQDVLSVDASNLSALDGIGSILYNMAGTPFDPAKY